MSTLNKSINIRIPTMETEYKRGCFRLAGSYTVLLYPLGEIKLNCGFQRFIHSEVLCYWSYQNANVNLKVARTLNSLVLTLHYLHGFRGKEKKLHIRWCLFEV